MAKDFYNSYGGKVFSIHLSRSCVSNRVCKTLLMTKKINMSKKIVGDICFIYQDRARAVRDSFRENHYGMDYGSQGCIQ